MTRWPSTKAKRVLSALLRNGWEVKRSSGSHRTLTKAGYPDFVFALRVTEYQKRQEENVQSIMGQQGNLPDFAKIKTGAFTFSSVATSINT